MLMSLLGYHIMQKRGGKKDAIRLACYGGFKVVFALLAKVIAVKMEIFIIEVSKSGL